MEGWGRWVGVDGVLDHRRRGQFRFARNLVRKKSTSRTFNSLFEGG